MCIYTFGFEKNLLRQWWKYNKAGIVFLGRNVLAVGWQSIFARCYFLSAIYIIYIVSACLIVFIFGLCDNRKQRILQQILHWPKRKGERNAHRIVKKDNGINVNFPFVSRHMAQRLDNNNFLEESHRTENRNIRHQIVACISRN